MQTNAHGLSFKVGTTVVGSNWLHGITNKNWKLKAKITSMSGGHCVLSDGSTAHFDNLVPVKQKPTVIFI